LGQLHLLRRWCVGSARSLAHDSGPKNYRRKIEGKPTEEKSRRLNNYAVIPNHESDLADRRRPFEPYSNSNGRQSLPVLFSHDCSRFLTTRPTNFDRAVSDEGQFGSRMGPATSVTRFVGLTALNTLTAIMIHGGFPYRHWTKVLPY